MAAMRARRPARAVEQPRRSRRMSPPASSMPRLAAIKLSGGLGGDDMQVSGRSLILGMAGAVLFCGAAIAGAAWLGSSLFDVREAFSRSADAVAVTAGFEVDDIKIAGITGARADEVRALIVPEGRHSLLSLDPAEVKTRVESLDWVANASVRRLWPSTLVVNV